jgi:hypothetical protein
LDDLTQPPEPSAREEVLKVVDVQDERSTVADQGRQPVRQDSWLHGHDEVCVPDRCPEAACSPR